MGTMGTPNQCGAASSLRSQWIWHRQLDRTLIGSSPRVPDGVFARKRHDALVTTRNVEGFPLRTGRET